MKFSLSLLALLSAVEAALNFQVTTVGTLRPADTLGFTIHAQVAKVYNNILFFRSDVMLSNMFWVRLLSNGSFGGMNQINLAYPADGSDYMFYNHPTKGMYLFITASTGVNIYR